LSFGKVGESKIGMFLRARGNTVLPVYEKLDDDKIGPRLFAPDEKLIAPDMLVWKGLTLSWIEAKHKTVFSWHRITRQWVTGIDLRHYKDYLKIAHSQEKWPVWLLFLHESSEPDEIDKPYCPHECPTGLFGGNLLVLEKNENHRHSNWGPSGMVYWAERTLIKIATLEQIESLTQEEACQGQAALPFESTISNVKSQILEPAPAADAISGGKECSV